MRPLAVLAVLLSGPVLAQGELGLDLSAEEVPEEYRPALAVVGVTAPEGSEEREKGRAAMLETELVKAASSGARFGRVLPPQRVAEVLGAGAAQARACTEATCLKQLAERMGVHRVIVGVVTRSGLASLLTVTAFDPTQPAPVVGTAESGEKQEKQAIGGFSGLTGKSQAQKDRELVKKAAPVFGELLGKLATPLGKLTVDCVEPTASTTLDGRPVGQGAFQLAVPQGRYQLKTVAEGYLPYETAVTVEPQRVQAVRVVLVARPLTQAAAPPPAVERTVATPVLQRPGLYVALAGAAALAAGAVVAGSAKATEQRIDPDGDGQANITRAEAVAAQGQATLGTVLMAAGGAALAGGGLWFFLTPSRTVVLDEAGGGAPTASVGLMVGFGGTF